MNEQMKPTNTPTEDKPSGTVSRRDFLKRASHEAVQTGASLVPGAAVAKAVLGGIEKDGTRKPSLAERWATWRNERRAHEEPDATGQDKGNQAPKS